MTIAKIGKKFPWWSIPLIIFCVVAGFALLGLLVPEVGAWLVNGGMAILAFLWSVFISCVTSMYFWAGFGIMGVFFFIYFYRKNYAKKKVLIPSTTGSVLPTADRLPTPLFDEDTKVESA